MNPKVTIMIPAYNQENHIANAIESALNQDYNNIEIVISDDASTDNTEQVISRFLSQPNVKYYQSKENIGRVRNYRKLLYQLATGDFVINLDGDDYFTDNSFIKKSIEKLNSFPEKKPAVIFGGIQLYSHGNLKKIFTEPHPKDSSVVSGKDFILGWKTKFQLYHLGALYNREEALKCDFHSKNLIASDAFSLLKLCLNNNVVLSNDIAGQWNVTGFNESFSSSFEENIKEIEWFSEMKTLIQKTYKISKTRCYFWEFRRKIIFSSIFITTFIKNKGVKLSEIKALYKNGLLPFTILAILRIIFFQPIHGLKYLSRNFRETLPNNEPPPDKNIS